MLKQMRKSSKLDTLTELRRVYDVDRAVCLRRARDAELERLKRELATVKLERDLLKKAATYFAQHPNAPVRTLRPHPGQAGAGALPVGSFWLQIRRVPAAYDTARLRRVMTAGSAVHWSRRRRVPLM